jgi:hypothetical protein
MKRIHLFGMGLGSAALLMAGSAVASAPDGHFYNQWSATAGQIELNDCTPPACVVLLDEVGMMQARVRDTAGDGFFQTINVEDTFTGPALAAEFRNESFIASTNNAGGNSFDMAVLNFVDLSGEGLMQVQLANNALRDTSDPDNPEPSLQIYQQNVMAGFGRVDFGFDRLLFGGAQFSNATTAGGSLRIDYHVDNVPGNRGTPFTLRQLSGFYTRDGGSLQNIAAVEYDDDDNRTITLAAPIDFAGGDHIGVLYMAGLLWHGGPMHMPANTNRVFENYQLNNFTTGESNQWVSVNNNIDDSGIGWVDFRGAWQDANAGDALWDPTGPFGATPNSIASYPTAPDFTVMNSASNPFPDFPDHSVPTP